MTPVCRPPPPAPDICPNQDQMRGQVLALLPRGRAWGNHDGGPWPGTLLYAFWTVVAEARAWFNARMCDMREEFFCATTVELRDRWMAQYGLPDDCDPFPDLCTKVAALGGARCEYFQSVAATRGWTIDCVEFSAECGARFGRARFGANLATIAGNLPRFARLRFGQRLGCPTRPGTGGRARFGARAAASLRLVVHTKSSPAYTPPTSRVPRAGRMRFGQRLGCGVGSILTLQCLIERIAPAHALVTYEVI